MQHLTIGEVAQRAGLNTSAIRYYERAGLLPTPERVNGQRRYDGDVLTQLAIMRMAQEAGFTIEDIRTLVSGFPEDTPAAVRWREVATRKLPEVEAMIRRLHVMRQVLVESLACNCLTLDACAALGWRVNQQHPAE
ncbi:MAG: MerR family transcriptional regulator [Chloroflexota bacterium]|nr:MerR family transcriptional regulator [Chloroflexota bacterium]